MTDEMEGRKKEALDNPVEAEVVERAKKRMAKKRTEETLDQRQIKLLLEFTKAHKVLTSIADLILDHRVIVDSIKREALPRGGLDSERLRPH